MASTLNHKHTSRPTARERKSTTAPPPWWASAKRGVAVASLIMVGRFVAAPSILSFTPVLGIFLVSFLVFFGRRAGGYRLTNPLFLVAIPISVGCVVRPIYLSSLDSAEFNRFTFGVGLNSVTAGMLAISTFVLVTCLGFTVGQSTSLPRRVAVRKHTSSARRVVRIQAAGLVIFLLSWVFLALLMSSLGLGIDDLRTRLIARRSTGAAGQSQDLGFLTWLAAIGSFASYAVLIKIKAARRRCESVRSGTRYLYWALFTVAIMVPISTGSRSELILVLLYTLLIRSDYGAKLSGKSLALAAVFGLAVLGIVGAIRSVGNGEVEGLSEYGSVGYLGTVVGTHSWLGPVKTGVVIDRVPSEMDYWNGRSFATALVGPIPRAIWVGKPVVRVGDVIGEELFQLGRGGVSGLPPGLPGELFLNFGAIGIIIGGTVYGIFLRFLSDGFKFSGVNDGRKFVYAMLLVNFGLRLPGGDFAGIFVSSLMSVSLFVMCVRAMSIDEW